MLVLFAVVLLALCMLSGMMLRCAPFKSIITPKQKRALSVFYTTVNIVNLLVLALALRLWWIEAAFFYLRFGGILYAAVLTLGNILVIQGRTREHLFVFGVVIACHYLLMSVPNYVITFLSGYSPTAYLFVVLSLYALLLLLTYWPIRKLVCNTVEPFLHMDSGEYWNTIWFIPIAFFATKFLSLGGEHNSGSIQQLISSLLYIALIVLTCMNISTGSGSLRERQLLQKQLEGQKIHYAELKVRVEDARKSNHDFKHHIAAIRHYIEIDDKEGLRDYCDEFMERISGHDRIPYTGNVAADGVLYHYMQLSKQDNIDFHYSGTIHSNGVADVDLSVLLGNALDNALTACLTIPQGRSIAVISRSEKHLLSIAVHNTFDGKVEQFEDGLLSRKRENRHGVGIASMRSICERYGASMDTRWDDHSFTVMFMFPLADDL